MAILSLYPQVVEGEGSSLSFYEDTNPMHEESTLMT